VQIWLKENKPLVAENPMKLTPFTYYLSQKGSECSFVPPDWKVKVKTSFGLKVSKQRLRV